jgi:hypothetical protein
MTKEEFENSPDHEHMLFIGANLPTSNYALSEDGKSIIFTVSDKERKEEYTAYAYFELLLTYYAFKATDTEEGNAMKILCNGKSNAINTIEKINRSLEQWKDCNKYDFESFINQYDVMIEWAKAELEIKLLNSQIKTNSSTTETNRISRITSKYLAIFTFIASLYYGFELIKDGIPDRYFYKWIVEIITIIILSCLGIIGILNIERVWPFRQKEDKSPE